MITIELILGKDYEIFSQSSGCSTCAHVIRTLAGTAQMWDGTDLVKRDICIKYAREYINLLKNSPELRIEHQEQTGYQSDLSVQEFVADLLEKRKLSQ